MKSNYSGINSKGCRYSHLPLAILSFDAYMAPPFFAPESTWGYLFLRLKVHGAQSYAIFSPKGFIRLAEGFNPVLWEMRVSAP